MPAFDLGDLTACENELRKRRPNILTEGLKTIEELRAQGVDAVRLQELEDRIFKEARGRIDVPPEEIIAWITESPEGIAFVMWAALERTYPGTFSREDVALGLIEMQKANPAEYEAAIRTQNVASGLTREGNSTGQNNEPVEAPKALAQ